jgi:hypothetical protein
LLQPGIEHIREVAISTSLQVGLVRTRRSAGTLGGFAICTHKIMQAQWGERHDRPLPLRMAAMIRDWLLIFAVYVVAIGIIAATMFSLI